MTADAVGEQGLERDQAIVVRNSGTAPTAPPPAITGLGGALPEVLQLCNAIANAGEMIPSAYRGKPGAVLLAKMWGDAHDVDVFTAIQNLDVIDGKPWVKTQMRVDLATARGFEFRVIETTAELCTVEVWHSAAAGYPHELIGAPITARFDDRPRKLTYKSGAPTPWALHADDMLFAEVCRKADKRYVRTAAALLDAEQDYADDEPDPVDTIQVRYNPDESVGPNTPDGDPIVITKEEIDTALAEPEPVITGTDLRERIKSATGVTVPKVLRAVQAHLPDGGFADLDQVAGDGAALAYALAFIEAPTVPQ